MSLKRGGNIFPSNEIAIAKLGDQVVPHWRTRVTIFPKDDAGRRTRGLPEHSLLSTRFAKTNDIWDDRERDVAEPSLGLTLVLTPTLLPTNNPVVGRQPY